MEIDEGKLRACRYKIETNAEILNKLVDQVVEKYSRELDSHIMQLKQQIEKTEKMTNDEIEKVVMMIPAYLYFTVSGLETLGMDSDSAKAIKQEAYNEMILMSDGTITDKTSKAELASTRESLMESVYARAYKKLKVKTEIAKELCVSSRKILEKRIQEMQIDKMDGSVRGR